MATSTLRNVGGSVMMTVPKPIVEELGLQANTKVEVTVEDGRLIAVPRTRPKYTLEELIAECDLDAPLSEEDREWLNDPPTGREVL
ncbi:AbrB/MazE/SpoVT family DNA-binding domain-containing protein [Shinella pollutisoli]|uniref:AbrB/MazE/SpoVT family DNA-binding domain-containing protein n=1 Tax=Shinella pollutisoli TaxID=2250594 RepID=A0ABV7DK11_9HYPH|nr:AbrB/MazE/SpoVT family DNA-binding domain-containing protein [Shinella pollutisoli]